MPASSSCASADSTSHGATPSVRAIASAELGPIPCTSARTSRSAASSASITGHSAAGNSTAGTSRAAGHNTRTIARLSAAIHRSCPSTHSDVARPRSTSAANNGCHSGTGASSSGAHSRSCNSSASRGASAPTCTCETTVATAAGSSVVRSPPRSVSSPGLAVRTCRAQRSSSGASSRNA